jgi:hypothetical protein
VIHLNLGWQMERESDVHGGEEHTHAHHALAWGTRADLLLPVLDDRLSLLGELFGEDGTRPAYQAGLRAALIPDRLNADLTWGGHTATSESGLGWTLGLAWTPPSFF